MINEILNKLSRPIGYKFVINKDQLSFMKKKGKFDNLPSYMDEEIQQIIQSVKGLTMISPHRLYALLQAVKYISNSKIQGDIVECGVWRGGVMIAASKLLWNLGEKDRNFYLYDTYAGMSKPTEFDVGFAGDVAAEKFEDTKLGEDSSDWCLATLDFVKKSVKNKTDYNFDQFNFVEGKVEDTIPKTIPNEIAILRLDTDWYESTKHEMEHLFPRLVKGGVLIIDDYGDWKGSRKAVDEYLASHNINMLLTPVDGSVVAVKA